jgi:cytochrome P450
MRAIARFLDRALTASLDRVKFEDMPLAPGGEGFMGHNGEFRNNRLGLLAQLARSPEPIMRLKVPAPGVTAAVVNEPELVHEMLVDQGRSFDKSDMLRFALFPLAGEGLFTSNGALWASQRKLMAPLFHPKALERYAGDMVGCASRTLDAWKPDETFELLRETTRLTMSVAGKTLFDADTFGEADEIGRALTTALEWTGWMMGRPWAILHVLTRRRLEALLPKAPPAATPAIEAAISRLRGPVALFGPRGRELRAAIRRLDVHVQQMIDQRRAGGPCDTQDLLSRLLDARDESGAAMSDRQVRDEVLTLFVAGHETTATGLAWTMYYACRNPEVYAAMEREADDVGPSPTAADLPKLGVCLRAFREALRLQPPVYMFGRDSRGHVSLGGYDLPPRTNVLTSPWALHRLERVWPDPERFDPDRFLPDNEAKRHRYAYLPFGAGPRVCIGNHFAYMEAALALSVMLSRFRFESLGEDEPLPSATLRPKRGVRVRVTARAAQKARPRAQDVDARP